MKNALEGTADNEEVTIGCKRKENEVHFWVHNTSVIPLNVQFQIFQRSVSTKGNGRGLGTYSVKLLTERYLKGRVSFKSNKDDGTIFAISIPMIVDENEFVPDQSIKAFETVMLDR